ncbi:HAMP domain-containing histidine kinase [Sphaerospermopsis aphanizomenoides BCCUSP55]|uniref:sensor histidine kinase n=1 Tax=Sphaerospermopsis aphanizomenoides TaxID=459663 RepID=UPI00190720EB|nr:HAMP domain-containing sensor histidine kinase [Sphaerospermopsis aphanizomenoides]MBK1989708.1 HAMP domain-containing histidine kinase [Sphaerospermopsis aphanizomenoides BCCUSP55]
MTSLNEWLYLGTGIGLGIGFCRLFLQSSKSPSSPAPIAPQQQETKILQELKQTQLAYEMAREMSQFKAGFLARTTHELRSPLNGLIGLHQLILNDLCENTAEEREFVGQAYERSLKLLKMIDEILSVARTEQGKNKLEIESIQLTPVLQEVHQLTYMLAANRNYHFTLSLPEPDIYVLADNRWLRQILVNLVDTTILQMEEGSIYLSANIASTNNCVHIYLDIPTHAVIYSEKIDLMASEQKIDAENTNISSGMKLLLNQRLLEVMGGKLEIVPSNITKEVTQDWTRLQISMPLGIPEAELPQSEEKLG